MHVHAIEKEYTQFVFVELIKYFYDADNDWKLIVYNFILL